MSAPWGKVGASDNEDKSGGGWGLAVSGYSFQSGLCKEEENT